MTLKEALESAREGNFVTNQHFDKDESLHYYGGKFYYEDGAVVTDEFLYSQDFAVTGEWHIAIPKENVDFEKLKTMHESNRHYMLKKGSYMDCRKQ